MPVRPCKTDLMPRRLQTARFATRAATRTAKGSRRCAEGCRRTAGRAVRRRPRVQGPPGPGTISDSSLGVTGEQSQEHSNDKLLSMNSERSERLGLRQLIQDELPLFLTPPTVWGGAPPVAGPPRRVSVASTPSPEGHPRRPGWTPWGWGRLRRPQRSQPEGPGRRQSRSLRASHPLAGCSSSTSSAGSAVCNPRRYSDRKGK